MKSLRKWSGPARVLRSGLLALTLAGIATTAVVEPAAASCTDQYESCIIKAGKKAWLIRQMEYIECFAEWTGCVKNYLE